MEMCCVHVTDIEIACGLYICIYECHRHCVAEMFLFCTRWLHICHILIFYSCCAGFCLYNWHRVCCVHVDIKNVFFACVELPCVNMTDTERVLKLNLAPLCTACTLVWFDFVCILCVLTSPFWISLPERLCRPNFSAFFPCGLILSALSVQVFGLYFVPDQVAFLTDSHTVLKQKLTGVEHSLGASMVEFCLWLNFLDCGL